MKIYYNLPDSDDDVQNKMLYLLYENYKLNMMWKLRHIENQIAKEKGCMFIDREGSDEQLSLRFEGFSDNMVTVIKGLLSDKVKTKLKP